MSKVLIDRELLERAVYRLELVYDADAPIVCDLSSVLAAPSGTPAMPVKAYYHEWTDLEGVRTRSVGLEVRKEFTDAPLVLEADALARIACLEGEIAKRDETIARLEPQLNRAIQANYDLREELAACRVAVENCELFRARIAELESRYQRDVYGLNNEGDPIGGEPAGGYANDNARLRAELSALKAQDTVGEVVGWYRLDRPYEMTSYPSVCATWHKLGAPVAPLYATHVQQVSVPDASTDFSQFLSAVMDASGLVRHGRRSKELSEYLGSKCIEYRCFAAPAAPAADAGHVFYGMDGNHP